MVELKLTQVVESGQNITSDHFGGNVIVGVNTDNGTPTYQSELAHQELDIKIARYPAGEPDLMYRDGMVINGSLPDHLVNFLTAARASGQSVVIVTPTHEGYHGADILAEFTRLVMGQFSDVVHAFEIGNEYWNHQTETSYGEVANDSVLAIFSELAGQHEDVPIWVQMGDAGGQASEFASGAALSEGIGWLWRNIGANNLILDQLTPEARTIIDGVVEHYYFREKSQILNGLYNDQNIVLDHEVWQSAFGRDLTLNITEWNIRTTNLDQLGIRAASTLIAQFSFMMDMEVDGAYVWPPMHNTSTDLSGSSNVFLDPETGIVINSIGGAAFDLMSSSLAGLQYHPSAMTNDSSLLDEYVYADADRVVIYVTSRSNETESVSFSLGDFFTGASITSAIQIGYDQKSSDGRHYDYVQRKFVDSESVVIDGELYYTNEHDVRATITEHDTSQSTHDGIFTFTLLPYEVIELIYELPNFERTVGTSGNDIIRSEGGNDSLFGGNGSDMLFGGAGDDFVAGGAGNDVLDGGSGADDLRGGDGNDLIRGDLGEDTIYGDAGNDTLQGDGGADLILGDVGNDRLEGGVGRDTLYGGAGNDVLIGGDDADIVRGDVGDDQVLGASGNDTIYGDSGNDTLQSGDGNDSAWGGDGNDQIVGEAGYDTLKGGYGDDLMFGGTEADEVWGDQGNDTMYGNEGNDTLGGFFGEDVFYGGDGNDEIWGNLGEDRGWGGSGNDTLGGGGDNDELYGEDGNDLVWGGSDGDQLSGGAGVDTVGGFHGNDYLNGDGGNDEVWGNRGRDTLLGGDGNDLLGAGADNDVLYGGNGKDDLRGGEGSDTLTGGNGADTFYFRFDQGGTDVITDFNPNADMIRIAVIPVKYRDLDMRQQGNDVVIELKNFEIRVEDTRIADLSDDVFQFG